MKKFFQYTAVAAFAVTAFFAHGVEIGQAPPPVAVDRYLKANETFPATHTAGETWLLAFLSGDDRADRLYLAMLAGCQNKLGERNLRCAAFFGDGVERKADDPLLKNVNYPVGFDSDFAHLKAFFPEDREALLPMYMIVNAEGLMVWRGEMAEMQRVLLPIMNGDFDYMAAEARVKLFLAVTKKLQEAKYDEALALADAALETNPGDLQIIGYKVYILTSFRNDPAAANATVDKALAINPGEYELYLLKLKLLERSPDEEAAEKIYKRMIENLDHQPHGLAELASALLNQESGIPRIDLALPAARKAWLNKDKLSTKDRPIAAAVLAQACHMCGKIDEAIALQEIAVKLNKDLDNLTPDERLKAEETLEFYQLVKKTAKKDSSHK